MKLPQQVQNLLPPLRRKASSVLRYRLVIGLLVIGGLVAFVNIRISQYAQTPSDQQRLDEALAKIKQVRFDSVAIEKIKSLSDQGTEVKPQLPNNRNNPFQN